MRTREERNVRTFNRLLSIAIVGLLLLTLLVLGGCAGIQPSSNLIYEPSLEQVAKRVRGVFVFYLAATEPDVVEIEKLETVFMKADMALKKLVDRDGNVRVDALNEMADQLITLADMEVIYKVILMEIKDIVIESVLPNPTSDYIIEGHVLVYIQQAVEAAVIGIQRVKIAYIVEDVEADTE